MFKKILCATDLNTSSSEAVIKAVQLAHQYDSKIIMLNVQEEFISKDELGMLRVSINTIKTKFETTALQVKKEMIEEMESLHSEHIQVEYLIKDGKPNKIICEEAQKAQADLIIMGVSDKNIFSDLIFRSTASYVIKHVEIPVLVVPIKSK